MAAAQTSETLDELIAAHRCVLSAELQAVYKRPSASEEHGRFLVLSVRAWPQAYVQCMFADDRKRLYCEASNYPKSTAMPRALYAPRDRIEALVRLGFTAGPDDKNFRYEQSLGSTPDFEAIARLMLTALHDGYGAREEMDLKTVAPFEGNLLVVCIR